MKRFHRTAVGNGAWKYEDPNEATAADLLMLQWGINLALIDDWIESEKPFAGGGLGQALHWRSRMVQAALRGDEDGAEGFGLFLTTLVHLNQREDFLLPLAQFGADYKAKAAPPGESRTIHSPLMERRDRARRNKRILKDLAVGDSAVSIAAREDLTPRQVQRVAKDARDILASRNVAAVKTELVLPKEASSTNERTQARRRPPD